MSTFKKILEGLGKDVLTEETKTSIVRAFDEAVEAKIKERIKLETTQALQEQNDEHATKLDKLLKVIDEDHCKKFQKVVQKIDEDHSGKLKNIVKHYENLLKEEATSFKSSLVEEVSNYLELYVDQTIPAKQIAEACENTQAKNILNEMKKLLSIDEEFINDNIREALQDGKSTIVNLQKELNEAVKSNVKLNKLVKSTSADLLVEKKTQHMDQNKKNFVRRILSDKSPEYITENFDYVVEMFERDESDKTDLIVEDAKKHTITSSIKPPKSELVNENINNQNDDKDDMTVSGYLAEMSKTDTKYK